MEKIILFTCSALKPVQVRIEQSAINYFNQKGFEVLVALCEGSFPCCMNNPQGKFLNCMECRIQRQFSNLKGSKVTYLRFPSVENDQYAFFDQALMNCRFKNQKDIEDFRIGVLDLGLALLSNELTFRNDDEILDAGSIPNIVERLRSIFGFYESAKALIRKFRPSYVAFHTGRQAECRSFMRAAQATETPFIALEVGPDPSTSWDFMINSHFHDREAYGKRILEKWENDLNENKSKIGHEWFISRRNKNGNNIFVKNQEDAFLPEGVKDEKRKIISIFCGTWSEYAAIDKSWKLPICETPYQLLKIIKEKTALNSSEFVFVVRMHPNQAAAKKEIEQINSLSSENIRVILPSDKCDTYTLIEKSYAVVTYGSTVGIEATYWGIPSILIGPAFYENLNVCFKANSITELDFAIINAKVYPKENCLPYGFFEERRGLIKNFRMPFFKYFQFGSLIEKYKFSLFNKNGGLRRRISRIFRE